MCGRRTCEVYQRERPALTGMSWQSSSHLDQSCALLISAGGGFCRQLAPPGIVEFASIFCEGSRLF